MRRAAIHVTLAVLPFILGAGSALASDAITFPGGSLRFDGGGGGDLSTPLKLLVLLTILSLAPSILIIVTAFTRIVIVLAILRQALGMPQTPPNVVLVSLALFLTLLTMLPVWEQVNATAVQPYLEDRLDDREALMRAMEPVRRFMLAQAREKDVALILELARAPVPESPNDLKTFHIIPAFMISEMRKAFEIGFIIFLPFVLIDIIVASVLMSLGMIMVPPLAFSLPLKILLFVLIDGWGLLTRALVTSFSAVGA